MDKKSLIGCITPDILASGDIHDGILSLEILWPLWSKGQGHRNNDTETASNQEFKNLEYVHQTEQNKSSIFCLGLILNQCL